MPKTTPMAIAQTGSMEMLRQFVTTNLNQIARQLAQTDNRTQPMSMGGYRLTDVPDPSNATDVVNLRTLKKYLQGIGNHHPSKTPPLTGYFTVVWANTSIAVGTAPPYSFNPHRLGSPGLFKITTLGTGASNTGANLLYFPGGTGTGTKMLLSDLILPSATRGTSAMNWAIQPPFQVNDVVAAVVTTAGGISNYSLELLVNP